MPNSDYVSSGGGLKLKGVKDAGIKKSKRKKDKSTTSIVTTANEGEGEASLEKDAPQTLVDAHDSADVSTTEKKLTTKTEAERKYDETRRKRVRRGRILTAFLTDKLTKSISWRKS